MTKFYGRGDGPGYYNHFPPSDMNVSVQPSADGTKKIIVANKDFEEGEVIYKVAFRSSFTATLS